MEWLTDPQAWIAFATLAALEIVLGIDNIVFICKRNAAPGPSVLMSNSSSNSGTGGKFVGDTRRPMPGGVDNANCSAIGFGFNLNLSLNPKACVGAGLLLAIDCTPVELVGDA